MSLYRHVFNKEDLLDLMLDRAFGEITLPAHSGDWRTDLWAFAYATRTIFKRHTWLSALTVSRPTLGPNYLHWFEFSLAAFADHQLDIGMLTQLIGTLHANVELMIGYEVAEEENTRRTGLTDDQKRMYTTPYLERVIASGSYPNFARYFTEDVRIDPEQGFAFGLECVLDGLATRILRR